MEDGDGDAAGAEGALIVEVEDVVEDSAPFIDIPEVKAQAAVCSIAPAQLLETVETNKMYSNFLQIIFCVKILGNRFWKFIIICFYVNGQRWRW